MGEVDAEYLRIAEIVLQANQAGREAVRPGIAAGMVDRAARTVIEAGGYGLYFTHRTGHGLGMEAHEDPYMFGENTLILQPGMTFTVEPGIYLPGRGGVRIEDNVVVTAQGADTLSDSTARTWNHRGMTRDFALVTASMLVWGVGEGLFFYFHTIYLRNALRR